MRDLDDVVRDNQCAYMPYVRSGEAEASLYEAHPELPELIEKARRRKIDSMSLRSRMQDDDSRVVKAGKSPGLEPKSPSLKARASAADLMFKLEEDEDVPSSTGSSRPVLERLRIMQNDISQSPSSRIPLEGPWKDAKGRAAPTSIDASSLNEIGSPRSQSSSQPDKVIGIGQDEGKKDIVAPWAKTTLTPQRLDMRQIMAQASENRTSNISTAILGQATNSVPPKIGPGIKLSQKERKKLQQQQALQQQPQRSASLSTPDLKQSPWQSVSSGAKVTLKNVLDSPRNQSPSPMPGRPRPSPTPSLTLRQTVPGNSAAARSSSGQVTTVTTAPPQRSVSSPIVTNRQAIPSSATVLERPSHRTRVSQPATGSSPIVPRSVRHNPPPPIEPALQLSMSEILSQQQIEKDIIHEVATAKRSLQEIQEEQAFQEWWDQEAAATKARMEEEEAAAKSPAGSSRRRGRSNGGRGGRGRGGPSSGGRGRGRGRGGPEGAASPNPDPATSQRTVSGA